MALIWPTLILATLVSFAGVYINDLAVSWGTARRAARVRRIDRRHGLRPPADAPHLQQRQIEHHRPRRRGQEAAISRRSIVAASGNHPALTDSRQRGRDLVRLPKERKLHRAVSRLRSRPARSRYRIPDTYEQEISLDELTGMSAENAQPVDLRARRNRRGRREQRAERIEQIEQGMTAQAAFAHADRRLRLARRAALEVARTRARTAPKQRLQPPAHRSPGAAGPTDSAAWASC